MKFINLKFKIKNLKFSTKGFILPFAMILAYIILIISMGISDILTKEMFFSYIGRESQIAYYAADAGLDCALYMDGIFLDEATGIGIFPYNVTDGSWERSIIGNPIYSTSPYNLSSANLITDIKCAGSEIFNTAIYGTAPNYHSGYTLLPTDNINPANGVTSTFMLHMDQGGGNYGCALVSIEKKLNGNSLYRRIISRGYNTCDTNSAKFVERAIINGQ